MKNNSKLFESIYNAVMSGVAREVKSMLEAYEQQTINDCFDLRNDSPLFDKFIKITDECEFELQDESLTETLDSNFTNKDFPDFLKNLKRDFYNEFTNIVPNYLKKFDCLDIKIYNKPKFKKLESQDKHHYLYIVTTNINNDVINKIEEFMDSYGYALEFKRLMDVYMRNNSSTELNPHIHLIFSNKIPQPYNLERSEKTKYFYHLTPKENENSIKHKGLILHERTGEQGITYPPRTFFATTLEKAIDLYNENKCLDDLYNTYIFIKIDRDYIEQFSEIYVDPCWEDEYVVYITETIPYDKQMMRFRTVGDVLKSYEMQKL